MTGSRAAGDPADETDPGDVPSGLPPGGPAARSRGCRCSVLANAGHRVDAAVAALIDPDCPVHRAAH